MSEPVKEYVDLFVNIWKERELDDGIAMIRPMYVEFETIPRAWAVFDQFMFGKYVLVAPVLRAGVKNRRLILFGSGNIWIHYWTKREYMVTGDFMYITVEAGLGFVPFFVLKGSQSLIEI